METAIHDVLPQKRSLKRQRSLSNESNDDQATKVNKISLNLGAGILKRARSPSFEALLDERAPKSYKRSNELQRNDEENEPKDTLPLNKIEL